MWCLSEVYDSAGGMAKSAADLTALTEVLTGETFFEDDNGKELRVGFVDPKTWKLDEAMAKTTDEIQEEMVLRTDTLTSDDHAC